MTAAQALPYGGALDAVRRIETALDERDTVQIEADAVLSAARREAERLRDTARIAGARAGHDRRIALLAEAEADARSIRAAGDFEAEELGKRMVGAREDLMTELTPLLLLVKR